MLLFPHPLSADEDGLLAVGGTLSAERLTLAYQMGIFPWYNQSPILWWYTHPRAVIYPSQVKISKSMRSTLRKSWSVTMDTAFNQVMEGCKHVRRSGQEGTWITEEIQDAYQHLHLEGKAHSIEVWSDGKIAGGLYGVVSGKIFCGESMFALVPNASKVGLIWLARYLDQLGCTLIDCQQDTDHMRTMGSTLIGKQDYWDILKENMLSTDMDITSSTFDTWKEMYD